ncbi:ion transporter [Intestinibacter sp.]|uniref:ion transporter n=1 Tax=Intestinibacter sp. TaxID=1965304 RepID=UPI003F16DF50
MRKKIYDIIEITEKESRLSLIYDKFMILSIIISIIPLCFKKSSLLFFLIDKVTISIFIFDYILRWFTADYKFKNNKPIIAFLKYPFTLYAMIDLLSILPFLTSLNESFKLFKLFRINKAFRAFKAFRLLRYSKSFNLILSVIRKEYKSLMMVGILAISYIFILALIIFQVEPQSFETFFDAIYWSVVTLTTVGYGDIYPISDIGRIVSMISSFMGIAIISLPTGIVTAGYMSELNKKNN